MVAPTQGLAGGPGPGQGCSPAAGRTDGPTVGPAVGPAAAKLVQDGVGEPYNLSMLLRLSATADLTCAPSFLQMKQQREEKRLAAEEMQSHLSSTKSVHPLPRLAATIQRNGLAGSPPPPPIPHIPRDAP